MKKNYIYICLLSLFLLQANFSFATHIVGGDITVRYLSPNTFEVTLIFFRDCNPGNYGFDNPIAVGVYDRLVDTLLQQTISMPLISRQVLTLGDPCFTPPNLCVEKGVYQATVTIPDNPNGYYLSYHRCCRNGIITNIVNPAAAGYVFYCEIADPALHSSTPVFTTVPDAYMCQNFANTDNFSATDADGDSLVYSFTNPLDCSAKGQCSTANSNPGVAPGPYGNVVWQPAYSLTNPLGDPAMAVSSTGMVTSVPPNLGVYVFCVRVEEYRGGVKIGEIRRDFQFQVLVCNVLNVSVQGPNPICLGKTTTLNANNAPAGANYIWNSGQTTSSIVVAPTATGTYTYNVTATLGSCTVTSTATVTVNPVPVPAIAPAGNICLGENITLTASGGGTYNWNNGMTSAVISGVANGTYTVTVTNGVGCTAIASAPVKQAPLLTSSVSLSYIPCSANLASATINPSGGSPAYTYLWNNLQSTQTVTGLNTGSYSVTVTDVNGCTSVATQSVTIYPAVVAGYSVTTVCFGNSTQFTDQSNAATTSWSWNFGDGNMSTQQNPSHTYVTPGTFSATLTSSGAGGCNASMTNVVTVNPQPISNFSVTTVCFGNSTQFTDQSNAATTSWSWNFGDGNLSTQQNPSHSYTAAGTFSVMLTSSGTGGCNASVMKVVTVNPQPIANFSVTTVCFGAPTQFTNQSSAAATSWNWNFGDGNASTQQNPSYVYATPGTFSATLTSSGAGGCNSSVTNVVIVNPVPVANYSVITVCLGLPTQFTDLSAGVITQWSWNFGNGNISAQQNPLNTYTASGTYIAILTTTGIGGCNSFVTKQVTVSPLPVANFTKTDICLNANPAVFTDQSVGAAQWTWNFGDGSPTSTQQNPTHLYGVPGTYSVSLFVQSVASCTASIVYTLKVNPVPKAVFTSSPACFNNPNQFTDQSLGTPVKWYWNFGDGNTGIVQNPSHTYNAPGTYTVTLIVQNSLGCQDTLSLTTVVYPLPAAHFTAPTVCTRIPTCFKDITSISSGTIAGWSWNFGDPNSGANNISNIQNPCHIFGVAGSYNVILTATSNHGCQSTINLAASVTPPPVASFTANRVCLHLSTEFTNTSTGSVGWNWDFGDGGTAAIQNPSHVYAAEGNYVVSLIVTSGGGACSDTVMDTVKVNPLPVIKFISDSVCVGNSTAFKDSSSVPGGSIIAWKWNFGDPASGINNTSALQHPTHVFSSAGTYSVTLTATALTGCVNSKMFPLIVYPRPIADFSFSPVSPAGLTDVIAFTDLSAGSPVKWEWDFGDMDVSALQNPSHHFPDIGSYTVALVATTQYGCTDTIMKPLEIREFAFYIPNAFTPNKIGMNDFFFGKGVGIVEYEMHIFDRWGNRVFDCKVNDLPQTLPCMWDGKVEEGSSGSPVQEDVYVWKVYLVDIFGKSHSYIGTVTVVK